MEVQNFHNGKVRKNSVDYLKQRKILQAIENLIVFMFKNHLIMEEKKIYYKVIEIMPMESGTSQTTGKEWKSREFVAEVIENVRYPNQLLMRLSGDDVKLIDGVNVGDTVELGFNSRVRSYQTRDGKNMHSQENSCWKITKKWRENYEEDYY